MRFYLSLFCFALSAQGTYVFIETLHPFDGAFVVLAFGAGIAIAADSAR